MFAAVLGALSMVILVVYVNRLTALLTFISLIGYAVVYTHVAEACDAAEHRHRRRRRCGAAGPRLGRADRQVDPHALLLFLIIFVWTPPHFWALAIASP